MSNGSHMDMSATQLFESTVLKVPGQQGASPAGEESLPEQQEESVDSNQEQEQEQEQGVEV